jgi:hypothetical protein
LVAGSFLPVGPSWLINGVLSPNWSDHFVDVL